MFDEDLSIFFDDFAIDFIWQGQTARGILDLATSVLPGQVLSVNEKTITLHKPHNVFPAMAPADRISINGKTYKILRIEAADDGVIDHVMLGAT